MSMVWRKRSLSDRVAEAATKQLSSPFEPDDAFDDGTTAGKLQNHAAMSLDVGTDS